MRSIDFDKLAHDAARPDPRARRDVASRPARRATVTPTTTVPGPAAPQPAQPAQLPPRLGK